MRTRVRLNPITLRRLRRFRAIKRGYYSFLFLALASVASLSLEFFVNSRALVVSYDGKLSFPTYGSVELGGAYGYEGIDANVPVNYRDLKERFRQRGDGDWVLMPLIEYNPNENNTFEGILRPTPPSWERGHYLGTDTTGRDVLARLLYGFRIAIFFALAFSILVYAIGILIGCMMGYFGGWFDLVAQRLIEIWSNIPFLYTVIIIFSILPLSLGLFARVTVLLLALVAFSWVGLTYYMRTAAYKEKARDYTQAAIALGASPLRVVFRHILPNSLATIVTFLPFMVASAITSVTALDFLGFGFPPPTPSMGELLKQGTDNLSTAPWIVTAAFVTLVLILTLVTFVGEAVREAFDPKKFTLYQ